MSPFDRAADAAADRLAKKAVIERGAPVLWRYAEGLIRECIAKGWLAA